MGDSFIPQLDFSTFPSQILWFSFCFAAFYIFVRCVYVTRVESSLKAREDHILTNLSESEKKNKEGKEIMEKCYIEISKTEVASAAQVQSVLFQTDSDISAYIRRLENEKANDIKLEKQRFLKSLHTDKSKIIASSVLLLKKVYKITVNSDISISDDEISDIIEEEYLKEIDLMLKKTRLG